MEVSILAIFCSVAVAVMRGTSIRQAPTGVAAVTVNGPRLAMGQTTLPEVNSLFGQRGPALPSANPAFRKDGFAGVTSL